MKSQTKLLTLLVLLIICLSVSWIHFSLPSIKEVRSFKSMDEVKSLLETEIKKFDDDSASFKIKYIPTSFQRVLLKTTWVNKDYAVSDFTLALQKRLNDYEFNVHGRVNLLDNEWKLHISHQNTILCTIQIAANGTK